MKPKLIIIAVISVMFTACIKENELTPIKTDLTGLWASHEAGLTLSIENTHGEGLNAKFFDIKSGKDRYLRIELPTLKETFKIGSLTDHDMVLIDTVSHSFTFKKLR